MRLSHLLLFCFVFSVEVRVRAATGGLRQAHDPIMLPHDCWKSTADVCAIRTDDDEKLSLFVDGAVTSPNGAERSRIVIGEKTSIVRLSKTSIRLVSGVIWVRPAAGEKLSVTTEFGEATGSDEYWIEKKSDRVIASASGGDVSLRGRGSNEELTIERGLQNFAGRMGHDARAVTGLPTPISPESHVERWARLFDGTKTQFEKELAEFKEVWLQASVAASETHQLLFERKVASLQAADEEKRATRQKVEVHNREIREKFRSKFLSGD